MAGSRKITWTSTYTEAKYNFIGADLKQQRAAGREVKPRPVFEMLALQNASGRWSLSVSCASSTQPRHLRAAQSRWLCDITQQAPLRSIPLSIAVGLSRLTAPAVKLFRFCPSN
jgi:hypothetical protein